MPNTELDVHVSSKKFYYACGVDNRQGVLPDFVLENTFDTDFHYVLETLKYPKGWNDETVYCYVVKPADFDPAKKYPVAFLIHGGAQGSFGNNFHYRWNPQAYAGAGYAAVMVDFHGSVGYGQKFTDSITGDWGGKPLEDLQKGLAAAKQHSLVRHSDWLAGSVGKRRWNELGNDKS